MIETWYILEDGAFGDPREIAPGEDGVLRHSDGRAVAYGPHGPRSSSVDTEALHRDMKPEPPKRPYKTREVKAD